jgi:hypothetical protein
VAGLTVASQFECWERVASSTTLDGAHAVRTADLPGAEEGVQTQDAALLTRIEEEQVPSMTEEA